MNDEIMTIGKEAFDSLPEYVTELIQNFSEVSEKLRIGSDAEGLALFNKTVSSLGDLWELIITLISMNVIESNEHLAEVTTQISDFIDKLVEAQEEEDLVLLADIVEYEAEDALSGILSIKLAQNTEVNDD